MNQNVIYIGLDVDDNQSLCLELQPIKTIPPEMSYEHHRHYIPCDP
jgi:hypothetical protein